MAVMSTRWCARCGGETHITTMSFFDDSIICAECDKIERAHPKFAETRAADIEAMRGGNYSFPGTGIPAGLTQQCIEARKARESD